MGEIKPQVKVQFTVQSVSRPHKIYMRHTAVLPDLSYIDDFKKGIVEGIMRQFPGIDELEVIDNFKGYKL